MLRANVPIDAVFNYDVGLGFFTTLAFAMTVIYCAYQHGGTLVEVIVRLVESPKAAWSDMSLAKAQTAMQVVTPADPLLTMEEGTACYGRSTSVSPSNVLPVGVTMKRIKSWPQAECSVGFGVTVANQP